MRRITQSSGEYTAEACIVSDIRLRLLTFVLLSVLSFVNLFGAAAVFLWWLVFGVKTTFAKNSWKVVVPVSLFVGLFPSVVLYFTGGDFFYDAKIFVLVLLAFWFSASLRPGELMSFLSGCLAGGSGLIWGWRHSFPFRRSVRSGRISDVCGLHSKSRGRSFPFRPSLLLRQVCLFFR